MAAIPFVGADLSAITSLETIPGNGIKEITISQRDRKMLAFNRRMYDMYNRTEQPSFFISRLSWEKLTMGLRGDGSCWLPKGYEVYGFAFCLAFAKYGSDYRNYFRIRTLIRNKKNKTIWVEVDNIVFADLSKVNYDEQDCLTFINPLISERERQELNHHNRNVQYYKEITRTIPLDKRPITNLSEIEKLNDPENQEKAAKNQEGCVFLRKSPLIETLYMRKMKGFLISIGWTSETRLVSFLFSINPHLETEGMPCPIPHTACNSI